MDFTYIKAMLSESSLKNVWGLFCMQFYDYHSADTSKTDEEMKPVTLTYDENDTAIPTPQPSRKSRFAQLAQNINSFEDDLSHPTIQ